jgi:hypothetical protein
MIVLACNPSTWTTQWDTVSKQDNTHTHTHTLSLSLSLSHSLTKASAVAQACNWNHLVTEIGGSLFKSTQGKKLARQRTSWVWKYMSMWEATVGGSRSEAALGTKKWDPNWKTVTKPKGTWSMAQVVERLPS